MNATRSGLARFVLDNSLLLLAGTVAAVGWAHLDVGSYDRLAHPLHFVVNDIGMVFFFALAAKEVFEATLPGGALASPRRAFSPLAAAVGGMALPAMIDLGLVGARTLRISRAAGQSPVRRTLPSLPGSRESCFRPGIQRSRFFCCSPCG